MGALIMKLLSWLGPKLLQAWVNVLLSDLGKFYAENKGLFLSAVREAEEKITVQEHPDPWERREEKIKYVWRLVSPVLAEKVHAIPARLIYGAIETAVSELKGGK